MSREARVVDRTGLAAWIAEHYPDDTWLSFKDAALAAAKTRALRGEQIPGLALFEVHPAGETCGGDS